LPFLELPVDRQCKECRRRVLNGVKPHEDHGPRPRKILLRTDAQIAAYRARKQERRPFAGKNVDRIVET
jgi:hypothetical protein